MREKRLNIENKKLLLLMHRHVSLPSRQFCWDIFFVFILSDLGSYYDGNPKGVIGKQFLCFTFVIDYTVHAT